MPTSGFDSAAITARFRAEAKRRLARAASYLAREVKVVLSVPAPRRTSKRTGRPYATTPATPGAPPRKLTGKGRADVGWAVFDTGGTGADSLWAVVGTNNIYMSHWEHHGHPWLVRTLAEQKDAVERILMGG